MKHVLTKMGYMAIGCLLTLIGYHFGSVENNSADAQVAGKTLEPPVEIVDELLCRKLVIVDDDDMPRVKLDKKGVEILNKNEIMFKGRVTKRKVKVNPKDYSSVSPKYNMLDADASKVWLSENKDKVTVKDMGDNSLLIQGRSGQITVSKGSRFQAIIEGVMVTEDAAGNIRVGFYREE